MPLEKALTALREREAELARVQRIGQIGGMEVDLRAGGFRNRRSPEYLRVHGLSSDAANESHEAWVGRIHPEDRERVVAHFLRTVASRECDYEVEYRIIRPSDGAIRWILAKAEIERGSAGEPLRLVGAHLDITARRQAEEQKELVSRELSHRIANIFAVVTSLIKTSARSQPEVTEFSGKLIDRIDALRRAHLMVVPFAEERTDTLIGLIDRLISPYRDSDPQRTTISGDDVEVGRNAVTPVALIIHELVTNSVKYGSLSSVSGRLEITSKSNSESVHLCWCETGGPPVPAEPPRHGFGSVLVNRAARSHLGALLSFDWQPSGLVFEMTIPKVRLQS